MTANRFTRFRAAGRASWPEMFHTISALTRTCGLPIPIEIAQAGPGAVRVRLESNADAVMWMRRVDPQAARLPGLRGQVHACCDWMGWEVTITGPHDNTDQPRAPYAGVARIADSRGTVPRGGVSRGGVSRTTVHTGLSTRIRPNDH